MYDLGYEPETRREAEEARYYWDLLVRSYEAKLMRIEPDTEESAETMKRLFEARKERYRLGVCSTRLRYLEFEAERKHNARYNTYYNMND